MRFLIRASRIEQARKSLLGFARKAQKLGIGRIEWTEGTAFRHIVEVNTLERSEETGRLVDRTTKQAFLVIPVDVTGIDEIKLGDWSIVGTVALIDGIRIASDAIQIVHLNAHSFRCDHCGHDRKRTRNYLLRNATMERWIGTSCLSDYTGHSVKDALAAVALYDALFVDLRDKEMSDGEGGGQASKTHDLETVLAIAADEIAEYGFFKSDELRSTKSAVLEILGKNSDIKATEKGLETAKSAIEWIHSLDDHDQIESSYMQNCVEVVRAGYVTARLMGLAVSIVASYTKAEHKKREIAQKPVSRHIGKEGERCTFKDVTFVRQMAFDGEYGTNYLIFMSDSDGNVLKWSTNKRFPIAEDRPFTIVAKVKKHSEYKGVLQTEVTRPKFEQAS